MDFVSQLNQLSTNSIFIVASSCTGFIGLALSIYLFYRSKDRFTLTYLVVEKQLWKPLVQKKPFDVDLPRLFNGREIKKLTRSFVLVSNSGNKLLRADDFIGPSSVECKGAEILVARSIFNEDEASNLKVAISEDKKSAPFTVSFIRPKEGFIFQVDHTGDLNDLFLKCSTKQNGPIKKKTSGLFLLGMFCSSALVCLVLHRYGYLPELPFDGLGIVSDVLAAFLGAIYFILLFGIIIALPYLFFFLIRYQLFPSTIQKSKHVLFLLSMNAYKL